MFPLYRYGQVSSLYYHNLNFIHPCGIILSQGAHPYDLYEVASWNWICHRTPSRYFEICSHM